MKVSSRDRLIFPESTVTKGDLADYYAEVAGIMLPWSARRPISLVRCPQGRGKKCFFQKHDAGSFGDHATDASYEHTHLVLERSHGLVVRHGHSLRKQRPAGAARRAPPGDDPGSPAGRVTA